MERRGSKHRNMDTAVCSNLNGTVVGVKPAASKPFAAVKFEDYIEVSDEEIGVCGGFITYDRQLEIEKKRKSFENWISIDPLPLVRPNVRRKMTNLRPVAIDGSNASYKDGVFSGERLKICVDTFQNAGHNVKAFLPQFRMMHSLTREAEVLDELEESGDLVLTPSRSVDGQMLTSYDDRYVVEYAHLTGAVIVSRDKFSDLLKENETWKSAIKRRLTFYWRGDEIFFPKFPLGYPGPTITEFLSFHDKPGS